MVSKVRTRTDERTGTALEAWQAGVVGGIAGSIAFGALMAVQMPAMLEMGIPAMYGLEGGLVGWIVHISHGAVIGVVFAALLTITGQSQRGVVRTTSLGLAYGVVVWASLAVVVMPIWLSVVGFPMAPPLPNVDVGSLVGHAVYGVVLSAAYGSLER